MERHHYKILTLFSILFVLFGFTTCIQELGKIGNAGPSRANGLLSYFFMGTGAVTFILVVIASIIDRKKKHLKIFFSIYFISIISVCLVIYIPEHKRNQQFKEDKIETKRILNHEIELSELVSKDKLSDNEIKSIYYLLNEDKNIPSEDLSKLLRREEMDKFYRLKIYNNPNISDEDWKKSLEILLDTDYEFGLDRFGSNRSSYPAQHPRINANLLDEIAKNTNNESVLLDVLRNEKCYRETISYIFKKVYLDSNLINHHSMNISFDTIIYEISIHQNTDIMLLNDIFNHLIGFTKNENLYNSILAYGLSKNPNLSEELKSKLIVYICSKNPGNYFTTALKNLDENLTCFDSITKQK